MSQAVTSEMNLLGADYGDAAAALLVGETPAETAVLAAPVRLARRVPLEAATGRLSAGRALAPVGRDRRRMGQRRRRPSAVAVRLVRRGVALHDRTASSTSTRSASGAGAGWRSPAAASTRRTTIRSSTSSRRCTCGGCVARAFQAVRMLRSMPSCRGGSAAGADAAAVLLPIRSPTCATASPSASASRRPTGHCRAARDLVCRERRRLRDARSVAARSSEPERDRHGLPLRGLPEPA